MKRKYILFSSLILTAVAGSSILSYTIGVENGSKKEKSFDVNYITPSKKEKTSKYTEKLISGDVKEDDIEAEHIVIKITDDGYVTSHGDHYHFYSGMVPFDSIFSDELLMSDPSYKLDQSHIVSDIKDGHIIKVQGKYYVYLNPASERTQIRSKEEINQQRIHKQLRRERQSSSKIESYTTDDGYVFQPSDVIEDLGDSFIVRHGNHLHYIPKSDLSDSERLSAQSYFDGKVKAIKPSVIISKGAPTRTDLPEFKENLDSSVSTQDTIESKRSYLAKMYGLVPSDVKIAGDYFTYPHGNHRHAMPISQVIVGQYPTSASVERDLNHKEQDYHPSESKGKEKQQDEPPLSEPFNDDEELQEKIHYISEFYGVEKSKIQVQGDTLVWPHEDHHHSIAISDIEIPISSNDPEADFEIELLNLAKSLQVEPASITIKDGMMIVPHGDHTHSYKIKSPGWRDYVKNRIPALDGEYIPGSLDRNLVLDRIGEIRISAELRFKDNPKQLRRINGALTDFENQLGWGVNSTQGYLKILDNFDLKYVQQIVVSEDVEDLAIETISWEEVDNLLKMVKESLSSSHPNYQIALHQLEELRVRIGYRQDSPAILHEQLMKFMAQYQIALDKDLGQPRDLSDVTDFDSAKEIVYQSVLALSEDQFLIQRVELLNRVYDATNMSELQAIQDELNNLKIDTIDPDRRYRESLLEYLEANQEDYRLDKHLQEEIGTILKKENAVVSELENLKSQVKEAYSIFEEKQTKLAARITELLVQTQENIEQLNDSSVAISFQTEVEQFSNLLQEPISDKDALLLQVKELHDKVNQAYHQSQAGEKEVMTPDIAEVEVSVDTDLKPQIQEILDFINNNRRFINTDSISLKVQWLNKVDDLEIAFHNGTGDLEDIYDQLLELKTQIEPTIDHGSSSTSTNENDWTTGW